MKHIAQIGLAALVAVVVAATRVQAAGDFAKPASAMIPLVGANASNHSVDISSGTTNAPVTRVTQSTARGKGHMFSWVLVNGENPTTVTVTLEIFGTGTTNTGVISVAAGCCGTTASAVECLNPAMGSASTATWVDQAVTTKTTKYAVTGVALNNHAAGATCYALVFPNVTNGSNTLGDATVNELTDEVSW